MEKKEDLTIDRSHEIKASPEALQVSKLKHFSFGVVRGCCCCCCRTGIRTHRALDVNLLRRRIRRQQLKLSWYGR